MTKNTDRTLGERLHEARLSCEMSQEDVAEAIGVQPTTISDYELDAQDPSIKALVALAALYGVSTDWLLTGREYVIHHNVAGEETSMTLVVSNPDLALWVNKGVISEAAIADISEYIHFVQDHHRRRRDIEMGTG